MHTLTLTSTPTFLIPPNPIFRPKSSLPSTTASHTPSPAPPNKRADHLVLRRRDLFLMSAASAACGTAAPPPATAGSENPIKLDGVVRRVVARPRKSRSKEEKEGEEEVLVIDGIEFDRGVPVKFDVYVDDEDGAGGPGAAEFAGSLVNVPHGQGPGKSRMMKTCLRLGITDLLEEIGADDDDDIVVTLVPKNGDVTIASIGIQLLG